MTKSDLRSGMIVETLNYKHLALIVLTDVGLILKFTNGTWADLNSYREDLTSLSSSDFDIVSIRKITKGFQVTNRRLEDAPVIWKRIYKISKEEIAEKLGIKVDNLDIVDYGAFIAM